jgi:glycolate oxidase FAD binding subunit
VVAVSVAGGTAPRAASTVLVRLGGTAADVAAATARLAAEARRDGCALAGDDPLASPEGAARWAAVRDFSATAAGELVVRLAGLPTRLPALVAAADARPDAAWQADPLRGVLMVALPGGDASASLAALTRAADAAGARLVVERWPRALAASIAVWHPLPPALPLMRRLKGALDPHGILAPGRFVGRL